MFYFPPTVILRHRRENLKKCSLKGLEQHPDLRFYTYPQDTLPDLAGYLLLTLDAPPLTQADASHGLFLIDGTWRYAAKMLNQIPHQERLIQRSLPFTHLTAYPRKQSDCPSPEKGLATVEALYLAHLILGRPTDTLLDHYYWKLPFLQNLQLSPGIFAPAPAPACAPGSVVSLP